MSVEGSDNTSAGKKAKTEGLGKDTAVCTCGHEAAARDKMDKTDVPYCKIHPTKGHDLQECRQVEQLAEKQKQEYEKRDKEKGQDGAGGSGKKNRGGRGGHRGKAKQQKEKPARGCDKEDEDDDDEDEEESEGQEFQKATEAMCINGGASLQSSHRHLK
nr:transmembrane channel-like protein 2-A [Aegilops tauschii subsp. strangulata]